MGSCSLTPGAWAGRLSASPCPPHQVPAPCCLRTKSVGVLGSGAGLYHEDGGPAPWSRCAPALATGRGTLVHSLWATGSLTEGRHMLSLNQVLLSLRTLSLLTVRRKVPGNCGSSSGGSWLSCSQQDTVGGGRVSSDLRYCNSCQSWGASSVPCQECDQCQMHSYAPQP